MTFFCPLSRPPRGGRGLKFSVPMLPVDFCESPSSRRAWIEILLWSTLPPAFLVALLAEGVD